MSATEHAMASAIRIRPIAAAQLLVLCLLFAVEARAINFFYASDPESGPILLRVNFITEIHGAKDSVEINGRMISDYSPVIIEVFSSTGIALDYKGHIMTFLGYHWMDIDGQDPRIEISSNGGHSGRWLIGIDQSTVSVVQLLDGKLKKTPVCIKCGSRTAHGDGARNRAPGSIPVSGGADPIRRSGAGHPGTGRLDDTNEPPVSRYRPARLSGGWPHPWLRSQPGSQQFQNRRLPHIPTPCLGGKDTQKRRGYPRRLAGCVSERYGFGSKSWGGNPGCGIGQPGAKGRACLEDFLVKYDGSASQMRGSSFSWFRIRQ
jgi:hypothetical protein